MKKLYAEMQRPEKDDSEADIISNDAATLAEIKSAEINFRMRTTINAAMRKHGLTDSDLARRTGIRVSTINRMLNPHVKGAIEDPKFDKVCMMYEALGLNLTWPPQRKSNHK